MKKLFLILPFLFLFSKICFSQQIQQQYWYLNNQKIDVGNGVATSSTYGNNSNSETITNAIYDQNGDVVLYVSDFEVHGSSSFLGYLTPVNNSCGMVSEIEIIPVPETSCQYYIIYNATIQDNTNGSCPCCFTTQKVYYAKVDLQANNGGAIIDNQEITNSSYSSTGIAITRENNNLRNLYIATSINVLKYTISSNGIIYESNIYSDTFPAMSELDLSHQEDKLVLPYLTSNIKIVHLDNNGNLDVSSGNQGDGTSIYGINESSIGVEFSVDGDYLYYNNSYNIYQLDLTTGNNVLISNSSNYSWSQLELGYDLNIYAVSTDNKLGQITNIETNNPLFNQNILTGGLNIQTGKTHGNEVKTLPNQVDGADYSTFFQDCCINNDIVIDLPSIISMCTFFQEICGPVAPNGNTYTYQWYGDNLFNEPPSSVLLGEEMCFTPWQTGKYTLAVTDDNGCTSSHTVLVTDQIPQPDLGNNIVIDCENNAIGIIDIIGQGYDNPDYTITWYHNGQIVQTGGETLMTSFTDGEIMVVVSLDGCESVSDSITITAEPCCPDDLELAIDCETGELYVRNLPEDIAINTIFWNLNNELIPSATNTTLQITEEGTYSFGIIFTLSNGVECHHFIHYEYLEDDCPNTIICPDDLELAINCETGELYVENLPSDITINNTYWYLNNELLQSGVETTFQVTEEGIHSFGIIFTLSNGVECHHFIHYEYLEDYCCEENGPNPIATILNSDQSILLEETKYGPMTVPVVDCRLSIDGSLSTCEDYYHISIQAFNPSDWTSSGPVIYNQEFFSQAPNLIEIPVGTFPPSSNGQFYILTFSVGSPTTSTYVGFWYTCQAEDEGTRKNNLILNNEVISLFPNPTDNVINLKTNFDSGTYQISDLHGKIVNQDILNSTNTLIDLSKFNSGIYFLRIQNLNGDVYYKKIIKE